ncbi:MAG: alpha/beta fold hydrolase [Nannocystis sp.]|nr:alpha/beta fold hydrolase [Nannocystis sp.]
MRRSTPLALALLLTACATKSPPPAAPPSAPAEAGPAPAPAPAPQREPSRWTGAITVGAASLSVTVHLLPDPTGGWSGAIDIPQQGAKGLALQDVSFDDTSLEFTLAPPGAPEARVAVFALERSGDRAEGVMEQAGQTMPVKLRLLASGEDTSPRRPQTPVAPFPYQTTELTLARGAVTLACTLVLPQGTGPFPAFALLTGSGAQDRDETIFDHRPFAVLADDLGRSGVATLRCDDRGVGGSSGDTSLTTHPELADDALAMLDRLAAEPALKGSRRGLLGHSEGAQIALVAAAKRPAAVDMLVLLAGMGVPAQDLLAAQLAALSRAGGSDEANITELVARQQDFLKALTGGRPDAEIDAKLRALVLAQSPALAGDAAALDQVLAAQRAALTSPWFRSFLKADPAQQLRKLKRPAVLALGGGLDLQVPAADNLAAIAAGLRRAGNKDVTTLELPGLNHLFQPATKGTLDEYGEIETTLDPAALAQIRAWILQRR